MIGIRTNYSSLTGITTFALLITATFLATETQLMQRILAVSTISATPSTNSMTNTSATNTKENTVIASSDNNSKTFHLFTAKDNEINETRFEIPSDTFHRSTLIVNKGDIITMHFYNVDQDRHTFTIGAPYNIDKDLAPEQNATVVFKADHERVFQYYCKYHLPTMVGQLLVLP